MKKLKKMAIIHLIKQQIIHKMNNNKCRKTIKKVNKLQRKIAI